MIEPDVLGDHDMHWARSLALAGRDRVKDLNQSNLEAHEVLDRMLRTNIKHAVLDGSVPFAKANGMTIYEHEDKDPHFSELFNETMFNRTTMYMKKMLENYKGFESINVLVDVGGGHGGILSIILSNYPHIKAINFDLHHVVSKAKTIQGVEFVGGDMFVSVPSGSDAIFMKVY
ncbi:caffeic acid 3-O-methyltransferase 2-like [Dioscorea cayenensis subsp. rotundata]|uniref:Caffeic acid 3-O-methyltransferase 2-like n=1 Tax=Dioscorea cayennensis subsp. rotundata TaxID=55577 RepID=A0AB40B2G4_DIOCR|nr:caffeic acid 3-O-methyltransferase 2-like [Dioscorea cayenensis subsp. rotundata]